MNDIIEKCKWNVGKEYGMNKVKDVERKLFIVYVSLLLFFFFFYQETNNVSR